MKRIAILLLCGGLAHLQAASLGERLENAVRKSDAPSVSYLLRRLGRESLSTSAKKDLVSQLLTLSERVVQEEKKGSSLHSNDGRSGKLIAGAVCGLAGLYLSLYGTCDMSWFNKDNQGILKIHRLWKDGNIKRDMQQLNDFMRHDLRKFYRLSQGSKGILKIYRLWEKGQNQELKHVYPVLGGGIMSLAGLCLMYDSLRKHGGSSRVSDAQEVREILIAQTEELGS